MAHLRLQLYFRSYKSPQKKPLRGNNCRNYSTFILTYWILIWVICLVHALIIEHIKKMKISAAEIYIHTAIWHKYVQQWLFLFAHPWSFTDLKYANPLHFCRHNAAYNSSTGWFVGKVNLHCYSTSEGISHFP